MFLKIVTFNPKVCNRWCTWIIFFLPLRHTKYMCQCVICCCLESQKQNCLSWEGPLKVIQSHPPAMSNFNQNRLLRASSSLNLDVPRHGRFTTLIVKIFSLYILWNINLHILDQSISKICVYLFFFNVNCFFIHYFNYTVENAYL